MIKKNKGFTLVETLLSLALVILFLGASITYTSVALSSGVKIETKVENYVSLNRYVQCNAELSGKKSLLMIVSNKVEAVTEERDGLLTNIQSLRLQLENLNDSTLFECNSPSAATFLPNGEIEQSDQVTIIVDEDTNRVALINVKSFSQNSVVYTNKPPEIDIEQEVEQEVDSDIPL